MSKVLEDDVFCLFNNISYLNHPNYYRWPRIVLFSDIYQLGPSLRSNDISPFSAIKKLTLLHIIVAEAILAVLDRNTIPRIQLIIQYRLHIHISELSNVIARPNVFTHMSRYGFWLPNNVCMNLPIYTGLFTEIYETILRHCIVCMGPYSQRSRSFLLITFRHGVYHGLRPRFDMVPDHNIYGRNGSMWKVASHGRGTGLS